jgi:hypothetical protein
MTKSSNPNPTFKDACERLDAEVLDPASPLFAGRLNHPRWPDNPATRLRFGGPPVLKPLHDIMFTFITWSESWPGRFAEVTPLRELALGTGHWSAFAARHLEGYDLAQVAIPGRSTTVAFSALARGAGGHDARGRHAKRLVRDLVVFMLTEFLGEGGLTGKAKWAAVALFLKIGVPDTTLPDNPNLVVQRVRDRLGLLGKRRTRARAPFGDVSFRESGPAGAMRDIPSGIPAAEAFDTTQQPTLHDALHGPLRRLPEWATPHSPPADETIDLLEGPFRLWRDDVRGLIEFARHEVGDKVRNAVGSGVELWQDLVTSMRTTRVGRDAMIGKLSRSVSWYSAVQAILGSFLFEQPRWQQIIDGEGPTVPFASDVLRLYARWRLRVPWARSSIPLVAIPDAVRKVDRKAALGTALDLIAVVYIRHALCSVLCPEQSWDHVNEVLSVARDPHRSKDAQRKLENPGPTDVIGCSGLSRDSLRVYHRLGLKLLRGLDVQLPRPGPSARRG